MAGVVAYAQAPGIRVEGADEVLTENILSHLQIGNEPCAAGVPRLRRLIPQVRGNIENAANALGYYHSEFTVDLVEAEDCWAMLIQIVPGPPVFLDNIDIDIEAVGEDLELFNDLLTDTELVRGAQLNHSQYESLKNQLSNVAIENGFFAAQFAQSVIRLNLVENTADIVIRFDPGQRYAFGELSIDFDGPLSRAFIDRLVTYEEGSPYSSTQLMQIRQNLDQSQYFSGVSIRPQLSAVGNQAIPVAIQLVPRARHSYTTGIGFTTDTGPRLRLAYENRYQTMDGDRLAADVSLSTVTSQFDLSYRMPSARNPLRETMQYSFGYIHEDTDTFTSNRYIIESAYQNESSGGWLRELFLNYQRDNYRINQDSDSSALTVTGVNISRTVADNLINPSRGWRFFAEVSGSSSAFLSDTSFTQVNINGKHVMSLGNRGRLLSRFDLGSTWIDNEADLPASLRFFAGGDRNLRGFDYQSIGPVNDLGEVVGGSHLMVGSLEYDYRFLESWRAAIFYDAGNAFNESSNLDWQHTVGIGFRWISPIGPLRFDLAHPINHEDSFRIHITMGPDL